MVELLINDVDDEVARTLAHRAQQAGRSMAEEARAILTRALRSDGPGTRLREHFVGAGLTDDEFERFQRGIAESRAQPLRGVEFSE